MSDVTSTTATTTAESLPGAAPERERSGSLWADALHQLRRNPIFLISLAWIMVVTSMAVVPRLWTSVDPRACNVSQARLPPSSEHWFGTSIVGCDYYAHAIYGARQSLIIAVAATIGVVLLGGVLGMMAAFYGGWTDTIISRLVDIFLGVPFLLGAVVFLTVLKIRNVWTVALVLILLGWTTIARIMRGGVLSAKTQDYVQAARALGGSNSRLMFKHILPNAIAPVVVYSTILLGSFVAVEATLTFLGVGLQAPAITWGVMITQHQVYFLQLPGLLLFPAGLLFLTVLAFILMGDALRDALDPRLR
jgi:peptide/nickel transport system permease protein/oligopeptide transport system permease protein